MSFATVGKVLRFVGVPALLWFALPDLVCAQQPGCATCPTFSIYSCAPHCQSHHCPPAYKHCYEGPPHIHWHRGCPHPVGNPCEMPHWGYFEACWTPWPYAPNWSHCPTLPPAAYVNLHPYGSTTLPPQYAPRPMFLPPSVTPMPNGGPPEELLPPRPIQKRPL